MKRFLTLIALFSLAGATAQPYRPTTGRDPMRGLLLAAPTAVLAEEQQPREHRYLTPIEAWSVEGSSRTCDFTYPFAWANRQVFVHLGAATTEYEVLVNGRSVGYNADPNYGADFNVTKFAHEGRNRLEVRFTQPSELTPLESWKTAHASAPTLGESYVFSQPTMHIRDVAVQSRLVDGILRAEVCIAVRTSALNPKSSRIYYDLRTPDSTRLTSGHQDLTLGMRGEDTLRFLATIPDTLCWSPERPVLCDLRLKTQNAGRYGEYIRMRLGFRSVELQGDTLLVNGVPTRLRLREAAPDITPEELVGLRAAGYNTLKLRAGIASEALYTTCDTLGLYVIAQAPIDTRNSGDDIRRGGNPTNDPAWLPAYLERTADSYHATKRHPSVIAFSLAEKSANGINLYESYLQMKRLGESRPFIYLDAGGEWNSDLLPIVPMEDE